MQHRNTNYGRNVSSDRTETLPHRSTPSCDLLQLCEAPETSKCIHKRLKTHSFSAGCTNTDGLYNWDNANCSTWAPLFFSSNVFKVKMVMYYIFGIKIIDYLLSMAAHAWTISEKCPLCLFRRTILQLLLFLRTTVPFVTAHLEIFHCTQHTVIPKSDLYFTFCSTLNALSKRTSK